MKVLVLAAGKGERMRPLTENRPKPLLEVAGRPLIEYTIANLGKSGFRELVINTFYLGAMIEERLGDGSRLGVHIEYSRESEPLETGGGVARALPLLCGEGDSAFVVVNADIWCDYDFSGLNKALAAGDLAHLVLVENPAHKSAGDFELQGCRVRHRSSGAAGLTFSGISVLSPELVRNYRPGGKCFPLRELLFPAVREGRVSGELFSGYWLDVGTPERLARLSGKPD